MAIPAFIDYAVVEVSKGVRNGTTRGSEAFKGSSASLSVLADADLIQTPDEGYVVLGQATKVVQRSGATLAVTGVEYRGSSTGTLVENIYYDGLKVLVYATTPRPAEIGVSTNVVVDRNQRLYWS